MSVRGQGLSNVEEEDKPFRDAFLRCVKMCVVWRGLGGRAASKEQ